MLKINDKVYNDEELYIKKVNVTISENDRKIHKEVYDLNIKVKHEGKETLLIIETLLTRKEFDDIKSNVETDISNLIMGVLFWNDIKTSIRLDNVNILDKDKVKLKIEKKDNDKVIIDIICEEVFLHYNGILNS